MSAEEDVVHSGEVGVFLLRSPLLRPTAVKGLSGSLQHLQGESSNDVCLSSDGLGSLHGLRPQRGDHLSPVDQGEAL